MRIITVKFQDRKDPTKFSGRDWSYYEAPGLNLKVGDIVKAPTKFGTSTVQVSEVDVSESKVDERILPDLRVIESGPEPKAEVHGCGHGCTSTFNEIGRQEYQMEGDL